MPASARAPASDRPALPLRLRLPRGVLPLAILLALAALATSHALLAPRAPFDVPLTRWVQRADFGPAGDLLFWIGLRGVAGGMIAAAAVWLWLTRRRAAAACVALMLVADSSSFLLRDLIGRPRPSPDLVQVYGGPQGNGFPSGTAMHYVMFCGFLALLAPALAPRRAAAALRVLCLAAILAIGVWLVHHGRHWPSDVLGGYAYGGVYLALLAALYRHLRRTELRHPAIFTFAALRAAVTPRRSQSPQPTPAPADPLD